MPDADPYASMLGESPSQGVGDSIINYARRYVAQNSGAALQAANARQQARILEGQRLSNEANTAAQYGMTDFFTPERAKYAKSLGVDLSGHTDIAGIRAKMMAADEAQTGQMLGGQGGGAAPSSATPPAAPANSPDQAGAGAPATSDARGPLMLPPPPGAAGGSGMAAGGTMPAAGRDWSAYDWGNHASSNPPTEEEQAFKQAQFYLNKARHAAMFGLPGAESYGKIAEFYGNQYHAMLSNRLGTQKAQTLQATAESGANARTVFTQSAADERARLGRGSADERSLLGREDVGRRQIIENLNKGYSDIGAQISDQIAKGKIGDPETASQFASSINQQLDALDKRAEDAGLKKQGESYRIEAEKIPGIIRDGARIVHQRFKDGDRQVKDGVTYERRGGVWNPVKE